MADTAHYVPPEKRQNKHRQQHKNNPVVSSQLDHCVTETSPQVSWSLNGLKSYLLIIQMPYNVYCLYSV